MNRVPAYMRVFNALLRQITDGEYAVGDLLPPEPELEKLFNVSRTTVRKAVEMLQREGFVHAKQGRGTQVMDYTTSQNLNTVTSISETLERRGFHVHAKSMRIDLIEASAKVADELNITPGDPVFRVQRIQLADDKPVAIMKNYICPAMAPDLAKHANSFHRLYDFLDEHYGINIDMARDRITARAASMAEAEMLEVPAGTALIYLARICYQGGEPVCIDHVSLIGGRYDFEVIMRGRSKR